MAAYGQGTGILGVKANGLIGIGKRVFKVAFAVIGPRTPSQRRGVFRVMFQGTGEIGNRFVEVNHLLMDFSENGQRIVIPRSVNRPNPRSRPQQFVLAGKGVENQMLSPKDHRRDMQQIAVVMRMVFSSVGGRMVRPVRVSLLFLFNALLFEPLLFEPLLLEPLLFEPLLFEPLLFEPLLFEPLLFEPPLFEPPLFEPPLFEPPLFEPLLLGRLLLGVF